MFENNSLYQQYFLEDFGKESEISFQSRSNNFVWSLKKEETQFKIKTGYEKLDFGFTFLNQDQITIKADLGEFKLGSVHFNNGFLGLGHKNGKVQFQFGFKRFSEKYEEKFSIKQKDVAELNYYFLFRHKNFTFMERLYFPLLYPFQLFTHFEVQYKKNDNDLFLRLLPSSEKSLRFDHYIFGFIRKINSTSDIGVNLAVDWQKKKLTSKLVINKLWDQVKVSTSLNSKLEGQIYVEQRGDQKFQLSGGIRVPLNKLNSTCPMDYPVGLQIKINV
ncbi:hypothetical protein pb186bvf_011961 [Paramecium bursaria]